MAGRVLCRVGRMAYALPAAAPLVAAARGDAPKLNAALAAARARLLQPAPAAGGALSLALGNEACDLDSIACSLAYALEVDTRAAPVLNVARAELPLRNEAAWLLGAVGVDSAALTFADELDLEALCGTEGAAVALLDHNVPAPAQAFLAPAVRAVVDHHDDAARFGEARPRVVAPVGSCATLVAEMLLELEGGVEVCGRAALRCVAALGYAALTLTPARHRASTPRCACCCSRRCWWIPPTWTRAWGVRRPGTQQLLRSW